MLRLKRRNRPRVEQNYARMRAAAKERVAVWNQLTGKKLSAADLRLLLKKAELELELELELVLELEPELELELELAADAQAEVLRLVRRRTRCGGCADGEEGGAATDAQRAKKEGLRRMRSGRRRQGCGRCAAVEDALTIVGR